MTLVFDEWADGNIASPSVVQWFKFTATLTDQYIHCQWGAMNDVYVQLYDDTGAPVGAQTNLYTTADTFTSRTVTVGSVYYIRVWPYSSTGSGSYQIGFTESTTAPSKIAMPTANVMTLVFDQWADGNNVQWFKFTATAATQYIHGQWGNLNNVGLQLYDANGALVGDQANLSDTGSTQYTSRTVKVGSVYYIRVWPYSSTDRGSYKIGFTESTTAPSKITMPTVNVTTLVFDEWANGVIASSGVVQWFKFNATAATQYIHCQWGTLNDVYVQLYDATGALVGAQVNLYGTGAGRYTPRAVTVGSVYYVRVWPFSSAGSGGTYQIGFTTSTTAPAN
jgi:predicted RNA-binding protein with TRAM domain